jgi:hypothetical protein
MPLLEFILYRDFTKGKDLSLHWSCSIPQASRPQAFEFDLQGLL